MSTATEAPALPMICRALAIRREVTGARWPESREAQAAIEWKLGELDEILTERDRLLNGDLDPYAIGAPDKGLWWDLEKALEYLDDEALECAKGLLKRLDEGLRNEARAAAGAAREAAVNLITARRMAQL